MFHTSSNYAFSRLSGALAVAIIVVITGCAATRSKHNLSQRLEQDGYSFVPPVEPGWLMASRSSARVTLAKAGKMEGQSYLIEASQISLDGLDGPAGLIEFTEARNRGGFPRPRFRIQIHDLSGTQISGADCALSHIVAEDRDPGIGSNVVTAVIMEAVGTVCIHPTRPGVGISLIYSHRSFPEDRDRGFEALAARTLQTQQFDAGATQGEY